jgi:hypothetical protein
MDHQLRVPNVICTFSIPIQMPFGWAALDVSSTTKVDFGVPRTREIVPAKGLGSASIVMLKNQGLLI